MTGVFGHPWWGGLFGDPQAEALWSPETQMRHYLAFEAAYARALGATGCVARSKANAAAKAISAARPDIGAIATATARDGVPIPDLVRQLRAATGPNADAVHTGATSQDVIDTALACTLRNVTDLLLARTACLQEALSDLDRRFGTRGLMGRTRMQAAAEITVADRLAAWSRPLPDHAERLATLRPRVARLQLGGAVGTRSALGARAGDVAAHVAADLGLAAPDHAWHSTRHHVVDFAGVLSLISGTLGKMGQDIALMAQKGVEEITLAGGGGSSAMPHKQNPVRAELLVTLARFNATQVGGMHQALVHEQERSGAAWALEWMILPQMSVATARALAAACELADQTAGIGHARQD